MKLIIAYVRISRRSAVHRALNDLAVGGWSEAPVEGHGRAAAGHGVQHLRFEVAVSDDQVDEVAKSIVTATQTEAAVGDGALVIVPIEAMHRL